jgi:hypothetical protein
METPVGGFEVQLGEQDWGGGVALAQVNNEMDEAAQGSAIAAGGEGVSHDSAIDG